MQVLVEMAFGAQLYGTADEHSDDDRRSVVVPHGRLILLQTIAPPRRLVGEVDHQRFPLHRFMQLACTGDSGALDMLHAPPSAWSTATPEWIDIHQNRRRFHSRSLSGALGYARKQASKYGVKGERLHAAERVVRFLDRLHYDVRLRDVWDDLPTGPHIRKVLTDSPNEHHREFYVVCGRRLHDNAFAPYCATILRGVVNDYGVRARAAADGDVDWKAMSHALRVSTQVCALLRDQDFTLPLPNASYVRDVKRGRVPIEQVRRDIDETLELAEQLAESSDLPERCDTTWAEQKVVEIYGAAVSYVDESKVACQHTEWGFIAAKEYPGGSVMWCHDCGAWRDDDDPTWQMPKQRTAGGDDVVV
jgi:hypothetical protein